MYNKSNSPVKAKKSGDLNSFFKKTVSKSRVKVSDIKLSKRKLSDLDLNLNDSPKASVSKK